MKRYLPLLLLFLACKKSNTQPPPAPQPGVDTPRYAQSPADVALSGSPIKEASGIADSRARAGYLWVEQDSGNPPVLYLLSHEGKNSDSLRLSGAVNRDWEDICMGPGPKAATHYLYVGDIGDNDEVYGQYRFYRLPEPAAGVGEVNDYDSVIFRYPDGAHDAEAFLVDDVTADIYIITKRDQRSRIYRLPAARFAAGVQEAEYLAELNYTGVVSAALSPDGKELIVKTYPKLYYYLRQEGESLPAALARAPIELSYAQEAQGEAVSFSSANNGFFTLSEQVLGIKPTLNFYKKTE